MAKKINQKKVEQIEEVQEITQENLIYKEDEHKTEIKEIPNANSEDTFDLNLSKESIPIGESEFAKIKTPISNDNLSLSINQRLLLAAIVQNHTPKKSTYHQQYVRHELIPSMMLDQQESKDINFRLDGEQYVWDGDYEKGYKITKEDAKVLNDLINLDISTNEHYDEIRFFIVKDIKNKLESIMAS